VVLSNPCAERLAGELKLLAITALAKRYGELHTGHAYLQPEGKSPE
jgi:hypothetical protein